MNEKEKLINFILEDLKRDSGDCEICLKMGWKCPVYIPEDTPMDFKPDFSVCSFRKKLITTLNQ